VLQLDFIIVGQIIWTNLDTYNSHAQTKNQSLSG